MIFLPKESNILKLNSIADGYVYNCNCFSFFREIMFDEDRTQKTDIFKWKKERIQHAILPSTEFLHRMQKCGQQ